ncbi:MAG: Peptidyl-tRNA hydrolase [candidate division TM6 bacterium GW2011_GWF2_28_16]|nr:MAG: Peptidyl-tRNA hydrolase [candidate division TM6 bacterium GW2011_GWF2_28_16]
MDFNIKNIKAIIGLGNPGLKYYKNRHNIGFRILDKIAQDYGVNWNVADIQEDAKITVSINQENFNIILIKPQTFMNDSGKVLSGLQKKGIKPENILVVHDELEKPFGNISFKYDGSARGHNGLRSIISFVGAGFWRLRFGISRPEDADVANYVLANFSQEEESKINLFIEQAVIKIFQA